MAHSLRHLTEHRFAQTQPSAREISQTPATSTCRQRRHTGHRTSQPPITKPPPRPLIEQLPELIPHLQLHTESSSNEPSTLAPSTLSSSLTSQHIGTSQSEPERLSLLGLPGELRNQIFRYIVVRAEPIDVTRSFKAKDESRIFCLALTPFHYVEPPSSLSTLFPNETTHVPDEITPPLTKVSRQIRREAQSLLIEENEFKVTTFHDFLLYGKRSALQALLRLCDRSGLELQSVRVELAKNVWSSEPHVSNPTRLKGHLTIARREGRLQFTALFECERRACHLQQLARMSEGSIPEFLKRLWHHLYVDSKTSDLPSRGRGKALVMTLRRRCLGRESRGDGDYCDDCKTFKF